MNGHLLYRAYGGADYSFQFAWIAAQDTWRVYILRQPPYGARDSGAVATHRLGLPARPYICWTGPLRSFSAARAVAALWADSTQQYITTGRFMPPPGERDVNDYSTYRQLNEQQLRRALAQGVGAAAPVSSQLPNAGRGPLRRLLERIG